MLGRLIVTSRLWSIWLSIFAMAWNVVAVYFTATENKDGSVIVELIDFLEEESGEDDKKPSKDTSIKINSFSLNQLGNWAKVITTEASDFGVCGLHTPEIPDPPPD